MDMHTVPVNDFRNSCIKSACSSGGASALMVRLCLSVLHGREPNPERRNMPNINMIWK